MYTKRISALALAFIMTASAFAGCSSKKTAESPSPTTTSGAKDYSKEVKISAAKSVKESIKIENNLVSKVLKDKFNLVIDLTEIPANDYVTKMSMLFASGEPPEFIYNLRPEYKLAEWSNGGYLKGFTEEEVKTKFPGFRKQYDDKEWASVFKTIKNSDNKLYYFPGHRPDKVNMAWMYREDTMKSLNLSYPKTADELYNALKKIKDSTGKVAYVSANAGGQCLWAFSGFLQVFGMPELALRDLSYVDPTANKLVPYAFSENNYRDFLKYMNKLYKDGLIWKEFATATTDQTKKFQTQGNGFVLWGYPDKIAEYNNISKQAEPNSSWTWAKDMPSAFSDKTYYKREPYYSADGGGFASEISDEKLNRMLDYLNWCTTDEGMVLNTYGVEGVTFEKKDGKYVYKDNMITPLKATGDKPGKYGFSGSNGFLATHPDIKTVYRPLNIEVEKNFTEKANYKYFEAPALPFTDEETKKLADLTTSINDTQNEYAARFIMGQLDPNNDADWNKYTDTLNKLGLENFKKIRTDAYNRGNK